MLARCRLREENSDLLQAEKAFAYLFSNRGHFQLARGILRDEILVGCVLEASLNVGPNSSHGGLAVAVGGQFVEEQLEAREGDFPRRLVADDGEHVFAEKILQILSGFLGPTTRFHGGECCPKLSERSDRAVLFCEPARVRSEER